MNRLLIINIIFIFFYSCVDKNEAVNKQTNKSINYKLEKDFLLGLWIHDNELHKKVSREFIQPKANLSGPNAFGHIAMNFNQDGTYISFFDNMKYKGEWKIDKKKLYMKRDLTDDWVGYKFSLSNTELIIIDREYLMTFIKDNN